MLRVILFAALVIAGVLGDDASTVIPPPHPPQPTDGPHNTSTTSTTTTAAPTTTTPKPAPPPITTTVAPTPDNKPGIWNVTETNNNTVACVVATMYVNIVVPYMKVVDKNPNTTVNATKEIIVPSNAIASGTCGNTSQSLTLSWKMLNASLTVTFEFEKNNKSEFTLASVQTSIPASKALFPDIVNTTDFKLNSLNASAPVPLHKSYLCMAGVNFTLADSTHKNATPVVPTLILKHVQFQAFANLKENKFETALDCAAVPYVTPDIVPIAVGVSLAALVAVVLIAYVIGRRRSAARGYLSM